VSRQTLCCLLQQAAVPLKHQKLLGIANPRLRPQPHPRAFGHVDGLEVNGHIKVYTGAIEAWNPSAAESFGATTGAPSTR
jgi:hypothetical protein